MSFDTALDFLDEYMKDREQAFMLGKRVKWSTSSVNTYKALIDTFDRTDENVKWRELQSNNNIYDKTIIERDRLCFLAGIGRDLRIQFCCNIARRQRTIMDTVRYEILRLHVLQLRITSRIRKLLRRDK